MSAPRPSRTWALVASLAALLAYVLLWQRSAYWSDGRDLLAAAEEGLWWGHHIVLYRPLSQAVRLAFGALGLDAETALLALSSLATAVGVGATVLAAGALGARPVAAVAGGLLLAFAPTALFFATCIEVHAPNLCVAGIAALVLARRRASADPRPDALAVVLLGALLAISHPSGLLAAPFLAAYALAGGRRIEPPRRWPLGLALLALLAWPAYLRFGTGTNAGLIRSAVTLPAARLPLGDLARELGGGAALLLALPALAVLPRRGEPGRRARARLALAAALLLPYALVAPLGGIVERGAYFSSLLPALGVASALALERCGRLALPLGAVLLAGQVPLGLREVRGWVAGYEGVEWSRELIDEVGGRGYLFAFDHGEWQAVAKHSRMFGIFYAFERDGALIPVPLEEWHTRVAMEFIDVQLAAGGRAAVSRRVVAQASEDPALALMLERLAERYGVPVETRRPEYLLYPAREPPREPTQER